MNILNNKRGVSPLIATVLLVMIVVSIGAAVMMVIRGISDDQLDKIQISAKEIQCGTDVKPKVFDVGGIYKYCFARNETNQSLRIMLENDGTINIEDWKLTVVGSSMFETNESIYGGLTKGEIKIISFGINKSTHLDSFQKIRILPIIKGSGADPLLVCKEPMLEWNKNEIDEIPNCPFT
jgi:flagellin-like protein